MEPLAAHEGSCDAIAGRRHDPSREAAVPGLAENPRDLAQEQFLDPTAQHTGS